MLNFSKLYKFPHELNTLGRNSRVNNGMLVSIAGEFPGSIDDTELAKMSHVNVLFCVINLYETFRHTMAGLMC